MRTLALAAALLVSCKADPAPTSGASTTTAAAAPAGQPDAYAQQIDEWHKGRVARLTSDTGWLTVSGLLWLKDGPQTAGSDEANDVRFPAGAPKKLGVFERRGKQVHFKAEPGVTVTSEGKPVTELDLMSDADDGKPTVLQTGSFSFFPIQRDVRMAIRVRDTEAKARKAFTRIERYPVLPQARVEARWQPFDKPVKLPVPTILGTIDQSDSPGVAAFEYEGQQLKLQPIVEGDGHQLFFIFADATSGKETYGAGRFLYAELPKDGKVVLDFNKAYNPPCAFTAYATCPLPPEGNRLAVAVRAGEKNYGHH